ncbi:phosphoenolpyruvate--protein phosphotransferase [Phormidium sp. LEGE 05292]|uniref:phosphoenolpyruvate--protein phosphotransferase n=1 Tax=[Phormidium] sp. LEGE 05292 TaxID=767427 RepID=UPI001880BEA3|nr:phosphoenolpyruvate--protein phosphotransferase [Phormidium sp. LEGE 05292]MBE9228618.1 phosphoenolpyruvate--protein phosphotransferase [Phormidium sp. LEGE 05292]
MVGIVIVSHSKQLALGVQELAAQMVQGTVPLAIAAGIADHDNPLGTDPIQVQEAIASVFSDDGVLVLMDLGSAVMSAEMALEFLPEAQRQKVYLCAAPLVEGAIAAVVAAASGSNIEQVIAEAQGALVAKASQLGITIDNSNNTQPIAKLETATQEIRLTINNRFGLHARPAAQFVSTVAQFPAQVWVQNLTRGTQPVRGDSINQVATLGVRQGDELAISATGVDADAVLTALKTLIAHNFGEAEDRLTSPSLVENKATPQSIKELSGIAASDGVAIAPVVHYQPTIFTPTQYHIDNVESEWQRLHEALETAKQEVQTLLSQASMQIGDAQASIFDAHLLFLADPVLLEAVHQRIREQQINAEAAWQAVVDEIAASYRALEDSYLQERINDVVDVGQRVLRLLGNAVATALTLPEPAILVATDLTPTDTIKLDPTKIVGICTTSGSPTSHSAIIARSLGIPAVLGVDAQILQVEDGTLLCLDGEMGKVWVEPEADILTLLETKRQAWRTAQQEALAKAQQPAITRDGRRVSVFANIGSIADVQTALSNGAEGVGLLRTEFLYLGRSNPPTEEEQLAVYQAIAQKLEQRPLIIRTLDVGGDKLLPYLSSTVPETNPFLGCRGIRFCLNHLDLFKTQLRAIFCASVGNNIKIMLPMVATVEEVKAAKGIIFEMQSELRQANIPVAETISLGIMIEVPSAVVLADRLAAEVDFFCIGTNDLSQYVMASDRTHPQVAALADAMHPAVLLMVQQTVQAARRAGIWVSLCGELAAERAATAILLGLGIDKLSVNPPTIPIIKQVISQLSVAASEELAVRALQQNSVAQVRAILSSG